MSRRKGGAERGPHGLTRDELVEWVRESCDAQGVPLELEDNSLLAKVEAIIRAALPPFIVPVPDNATEGAPVTRRPPESFSPRPKDSNDDAKSA